VDVLVLGRGERAAVFLVPVQTERMVDCRDKEFGSGEMWNGGRRKKRQELLKHI